MSPEGRRSLKMEDFSDSAASLAANLKVLQDSQQKYSSYQKEAV